ncbi:MAG: type II toxin-antitoxin system VapC family toxin [Nanoarchaeota archaeon]
MEEIKYFLDSYTLIEIAKENPNFSIFKDSINFTGFTNLLELHYRLMQDFGEKKADEITDLMRSIVINEDLKDIKLASKFRIRNIKRKFSYIDCLGYTMALNRKMKFVTGDMEFKDLPNVEFIK